MSNQITVVGTIATDPKRITTSTAAKFCSFRLASNERRYDREKNEWTDGPTNWFTVLAFRSLGEHAMHSFAKGDRVVLSGRLRVRNWEKDERSGTSVEIDADALGHDLRWGTSRFTRMTDAGAAPAPSGDDAERRERWADPAPTAGDGAGAGPAGGVNGAADGGNGSGAEPNGFADPSAGIGGFAQAARAEAA